IATMMRSPWRKEVPLMADPPGVQSCLSATRPSDAGGGAEAGEPRATLVTQSCPEPLLVKDGGRAACWSFSLNTRPAVTWSAAPDTATLTEDCPPESALAARRRKAFSCVVRRSG